MEFRNRGSVGADGEAEADGGAGAGADGRSRQEKRGAANKYSLPLLFKICNSDWFLPSACSCRLLLHLLPALLFWRCIFGRVVELTCLHHVFLVVVLSVAIYVYLHNDFVLLAVVHVAGTKAETVLAPQQRIN
jgi:hypothetical protein